MKIGSRALNVALQQLIMSYAAHKQRTAQASIPVDEQAPSVETQLCSSELERVARELCSKSMQLEVLKNRCKELDNQNQTLIAGADASQATIDCLNRQESDLLEKCALSCTCAQRSPTFSPSRSCSSARTLKPWKMCNVSSVEQRQT